MLVAALLAVRIIACLVFVVAAFMYLVTPRIVTSAAPSAGRDFALMILNLTFIVGPLLLAFTFLAAFVVVQSALSHRMKAMRALRYAELTQQDGRNPVLFSAFVQR